MRVSKLAGSILAICSMKGSLARRRGLSGLVRRLPERSGFLRGLFPWDNSDWVGPIAALLQIGPIAPRDWAMAGLLAVVPVMWRVTGTGIPPERSALSA